MGHTILSLQQDRFDTRICFGGCLINIDGETVDCEVEKTDSARFTNPTYLVFPKQDIETRNRHLQYGVRQKEICTFRPYHLNDGPFMYSIERVSKCGGDATLIVPAHGMLDHYKEDLGEDDDE